VIPTKSISRKHMTLERTVEGWKLVDQMSANGTKVNKETVNFAFIKEGDVIQVGEASIRVTGLAPAPGAKVPAAARPVPVRRAAPAGGSSPAEGRSAAAYIPPKRSGAGMAIAAGVGVVALLVGGWFLMNQSAVPVEQPEVADSGSSVRTAQLDDNEEAALGLIRSVRDGDESTQTRILMLDEIAEGLSDRRGSVARGELSEVRSQLMAELRTEIEDRIQTDVEQAKAFQQSGNYARAIDLLTDTEAWLDSGSYVRGLARPFLADFRAVVDGAHEANAGFIGGSFSQMWHLADENRFDDAVAVADEIEQRAWLDDDARNNLARERARVIARRDAHQERDAAPVVEEEETEEDSSSVLDRIKEEEDRLPGRNELLPEGERSEIRLLEALQNRLITAATQGTLTSNEFTWRGNRTEIRGANEESLRLMVFSFDRQTNEELPPYTTSVRWDTIAASDMLQLYDRTPELTAEDLLAVTIFTFNAGLRDEGARRAFIVYQEMPEWKDHIDNLIASKRRMAIPSGGFIEFEGMLIAPDEVEEIIFRRELRVVLTTFERGIGSRDRRRRQESDEAFEQILSMGERAVEPAIEILQVVLKQEIQAAEDAAGLASADGRQMDEVLAELDRRRAHALDLIMDDVAYPYPYAPNNDEIQADVNERVAAVREIWDNPTSFMGRTNPQIDETINKARAVAERMQQLDPDNRYHEGTPETVIEYLQGQANQRLTIREWPGRDRRYMALINYNRAVMEFNENFPTGSRHADGDSRLQVRITNEYRIMFARHALKINDKLFWASWFHSRYCSEVRGGQIAHVIPGHPYGDAPNDRARREGYNHGVGENMHMHGAGPTAMGAHNGWLNSSGHHRNILTPRWRVLGSAKYGLVWTQKFGAHDEGDGNMVSNGGEG
jgi:hypothetical protein